MRRLLLILLLALAAAAAYLLFQRSGPGRAVYAVDQPGNGAACLGNTRFAVIGDFGDAGAPAADVAALVAAWQPDFIVTTGDNNYPDGAAQTIDANIGRYYGAFIGNYQGAYGPGAAANAFFPALGNHDYRTPDAQPYLDYFTLPGDERTYDVRRGPVQLFILDSNPENENGRSPTSAQAVWLRAGLAASAAPWRLVVLHHPPYTSGRTHSDNRALQWDFAGWGATAVLAGHEHLYERLQLDGIPYFVNGSGGRSLYPFGRPRAGSAVRYNRDYGAMLVTAGERCLNFSFYSRAAELIDSHTLTR